MILGHQTLFEFRLFDSYAEENVKCYVICLSCAYTNWHPHDPVNNFS